MLLELPHSFSAMFSLTLAYIPRSSQIEGSNSPLPLPKSLSNSSNMMSLYPLPTIFKPMERLNGSIRSLKPILGCLHPTSLRSGYPCYQWLNYSQLHSSFSNPENSIFPDDGLQTLCLPSTWQGLPTQSGEVTLRLILCLRQLYWWPPSKRGSAEAKHSINRWTGKTGCGANRLSRLPREHDCHVHFGPLIGVRSFSMTPAWN